MTPARLSNDRLWSLMYRSRATLRLCPGALNDLFVTATTRNIRAGLTGLLLYAPFDRLTPGVFVQWVEGPRASVDALLVRLLRDPRHIDLDVLHLGTNLSAAGTDGRLFPTWSMRVEFEDAGALPVTLDQFLSYWLSRADSIGSEDERLRTAHPRLPSPRASPALSAGECDGDERTVRVGASRAPAL